jgi:hypothetical protein
MSGQRSIFTVKVNIPERVNMAFKTSSEIAAKENAHELRRKAEARTESFVKGLQALPDLDIDERFKDRDADGLLKDFNKDSHSELKQILADAGASQKSNDD